MKEKELDFYVSVAKSAAEMSYAQRKKVGACVITQNRGIYIGYNGRLPGQDNCCEELVPGFMKKVGEKLVVQHDGVSFVADVLDFDVQTRKDVVHGEMNALAKMLKEGVSAEGSTLVVTLSPCASCSVMIASSGVKRVVYLEKYRDTTGIEILKQANVEVEQYEAS